MCWTRAWLNVYRPGAPGIPRTRAAACACSRSSIKRVLVDTRDRGGEVQLEITADHGGGGQCLARQLAQPSYPCSYDLTHAFG